MPSEAFFRFHTSLHDFIPKTNKEVWLTYAFSGKAVAKDAFESIGIPHAEVAKVLANGEEVSFTYLLQEGDKMDFYPFNYPVRLEAATQPAFVLDVHLGKLARSLRMLGIDASYENTYEDPELVKISVSQNRIILTRDIPLLKHGALAAGQGYWLRSQQPDEQLKEVMERFGLQAYLKPFYRCMRCNGIIQWVEKETIREQVEVNTQKYFDEFYQCTDCKQIYWKGSHYEKMQDFVKKIREVD